jgi:DNA-binding CsgD family transcriptional regulator
VRTARAEAAWLDGDRERTLVESRAVYDLALRHRHAWHTAELTFWQRRAGERVALPAWAAAPFALQMRGEWRRAATAWAKLGCPLEHARALEDGDGAAQVEALEVLDRLGARPVADALRKRLRAEGVRRIPRGPRATTRAHPFGLTSREMEILDAVAAGLSNAQIGDRLHISAKTVDHHVSAILTKLDVPTRQEAARLSRQWRAGGQHGEAPGQK